MKCWKLARSVPIALATVGLLLPQVSLASERAADATTTLAVKMIDVALHEDGSLRGQVLDSQGTPVPETTLAVVHQGKAVAAVKTDQEGHYSVPALKPGVYQVVTDKGITVCRAWTARTAPPSSQAEALVVNGDQVIRGGLGNGGVGAFLSNPWVLGAIVATAIAVPLALDDKDDGS